MSFVDNYTPDLGYGLFNDGAQTGIKGVGPTDSGGGSFFSGLGLSNKEGTGLIGAGVAGAGLLYDVLKGDQPSVPVQNLTQEAGQFGTQGSSLLGEGQQLQSYLTGGTLPPALQAQLTLKQNAAKAALIQGAASKGMNTSLTGNSGLSQDVSNLDLQTLEAQGKLEEQLFQAGTGLIDEGQKFLGMQTNIQETLAKIDEQQQQNTTNAIMSFAKALGGIFSFAG